VIDKIQKTQSYLEAGENVRKGKEFKEFEPIVTEDGMSFLEMKYNLMLSYCQFLSLYLLMKLDSTHGQNISKHPIIARLLHIKLLFERLRPLD
jgi:hypothetical protein